MEVGDLILHTFRYMDKNYIVTKNTETLLVEKDEGDIVVLRSISKPFERIYAKDGTFKLPKEYLLKNAKLLNGKNKI